MEAKTPFYGYCGDCLHEWVICYLPMEVSAAVKFMTNPCPKCVSSKVYVCKPKLT